MKLAQPLDWLGLSCRVPEDWEVVRHSLSPEIGKLVLVDRRKERLVLSWTACKRPPDMQQLLRDYGARAKLELAGKVELERRRLSGTWLVLTERRQGASRTLHHAVSYHARTSRLVEALIVTSSDDERPLVDDIVNTLRVTAPAHESTRTRLFGVDLTAPATFRVVHTAIKPADVTLTLEPRQPSKAPPTKRARKARVTVRRLGMAAAWSHDDLENILPVIDPGARYRHKKAITHGGHAALKVEAPAPRWLPGTGRQALLWRCPDENALYLLALEQPKRARVALTDFVLGCRGTT